MRTEGRVVARIDHDDADGPLLQTSVSGELQPLTAAPRCARAFFGMPLMTLGVIVRIHWQALRLWRQACALLHQARAAGHLHFALNRRPP